MIDQQWHWSIKLPFIWILNHIDIYNIKKQTAYLIRNDSGFPETHALNPHCWLLNITVTWVFVNIQYSIFNITQGYEESVCSMRFINTISILIEVYYECKKKWSGLIPEHLQSLKMSEQLEWCPVLTEQIQAKMRCFVTSGFQDCFINLAVDLMVLFCICCKDWVCWCAGIIQFLLSSVCLG